MSYVNLFLEFWKILSQALLFFIFLFLSPLWHVIILWCPHFFSGLVVPDVPLEETEILRMESIKNNIELVCCLFKFSFLSGEASGLIWNVWLIVFE